MSDRKYHNDIKPAGPDLSGASTKPADFKKKKVVLWNIEELEEFFREAKLPDGAVKLNNSETIINTKQFLESSIATVKKHNGNKTFFPYYERLVKFKKIIEKGKNS